MAPLSPADLPGGAVACPGQPRQQPSGASGGGAADQELADVQGPRHQGSVPAAMARHRRQRTQGGQELRKLGDFGASPPVFSQGEHLVHPFPPDASSIARPLLVTRPETSSALAWVLCCLWRVLS